MGAVGSHHEASGELEVATVPLAVEAYPTVLSLRVHHAGPQQVGARGLGLLAEQLVQVYPVYRQGAGVAAADGQLAAAGGVDVGAGQAVGHYRLPDVRLLQRARADQPRAVGGHTDASVFTNIAYPYYPGRKFYVDANDASRVLSWPENGTHVFQQVG